MSGDAPRTALGVPYGETNKMGDVSRLIGNALRTALGVPYSETNKMEVFPSRVGIY